MAERSAPWRRRAVRLFGCGFDVLTVALGVTDVVSDIMVCVQFYQQGLWVPFGFCVLILLNANVVYTHFSVEQGLLASPPMFGHVGLLVHERLVAYPRRRLILYGLVFPVAQAMPALNWLLCKMSAPPDTKGPQPRRLMDTLHGALEEHWRSHGLFFVETVVESIPQSILQLIVITILDQVTAIQILSIVLSIVSIISKAYALSLSLDLRVFALKLLMLSYDVLAMFFLFASLFAPPTLESGTCPLAGLATLNISMLACVWLWYFLALCPFFVLGGFLLGLYLPARAAHDGDSTAAAGRLVAIWASVWLPVLVLLPVPKLSPLVLWIYYFEPEKGTSREASALMARLFSFATAGGGDRMTAKLRGINLHLSTHFEQLYRNTVRPEYAALLESCVLTCRRTRQWCLTEPFCPAQPPAIHRISRHPDLDEVKRLVTFASSCTRQAVPGCPEQDAYFCHTCHLTVCDICTQKCHRHHWVEFIGTHDMRCGCGTWKPCQAWTAV
eukprot:EG_transcript_10360